MISPPGTDDQKSVDQTSPLPEPPEAGLTVYSREGGRAEYVTALDGSHIVRPWVSITSWDGEDQYSEPAGLEVWPEVFPEPPVPVLETEIVELQASIDAKRRELAAATDEAAGFIRDERERVARIKRHEALARLDDFLSGNISHAVKISYGTVTIHEFKEVVEQKDRYDRDGLKLLTLFGKPGNGLQWRVSDYSDGSGSSLEVVPCHSQEEAFAIATDRLNEHFARATEERAYWLDSAVKSADALGIPVPPIARERMKKDALAALEGRRKTEMDALTKIEADIAALTAMGAKGDQDAAADDKPGMNT